MKQIYFLIIVLAGGILLNGCGRGGDRGELTGIPQRSFRAEVPYGMVYIPS